MNINVSQLTRRKTTKQEVHLTLDNKDLFVGEEEIKIMEPINVDGVLSVVGDIMHLDAQVEAKLLLQCSRCIEDFIHLVNVEVHEKFTNNFDDKDDNLIFIEGDSIDITEIIENNIFLALPIKKLCSENCKGLCQKCGINLNYHSCDCDNEVIDPRLAKLKDLF
jgi:Predicted metal-binding, possibly nucleic acid-binding protein